MDEAIRLGHFSQVGFAEERLFQEHARHDAIDSNSRFESRSLATNPTMMVNQREHHHGAF